MLVHVAEPFNNIPTQAQNKQTPHNDTIHEISGANGWVSKWHTDQTASLIQCRKAAIHSLEITRDVNSLV